MPVLLWDLLKAAGGQLFCLTHVNVDCNGEDATSLPGCMPAARDCMHNICWESLRRPVYFNDNAKKFQHAIDIFVFFLPLFVL